MPVAVALQEPSSILMDKQVLSHQTYIPTSISEMDKSHNNGVKETWTSSQDNQMDKQAHRRSTNGTIHSVRTFGSRKNNTSNDTGQHWRLSMLSNNDEDLSTRHIDTDRNTFLSTILNRFPSSHFALSDNFKFTLNCCMWYSASSLTNNSGKQILIAFKFPVTLTFVQFGMVASWCFIVANIFSASRIRTPTQDILTTIAPLALFLIVGHVFSSISISRIPVSLVHTIKALAPLFTVLIYRFIFNVSYRPNVYISLLPLICGVILACSFTFSNNTLGLMCALASCIVFVSQNIFNKKVLFKESQMGDRNPNKLDKINVLFYSSSLSFLLMSPLWLYSDGVGLLTGTSAQLDISKSRLIFYFLLNGASNFCQNWFAFTTLSLTSPVTYSILSLIKRIFVIVVSIIWFGQHVTTTQSLGIILTFIGLWMYQNAKHDIELEESKLIEKTEAILPTSLGASNGKSSRMSFPSTAGKALLPSWIPLLPSLSKSQSQHENKLQ